MADETALHIRGVSLKAGRAAIDEIIRPYIRATRSPAPADGAVASVSIRGVVDPRFLGGST